MIPTILNQTLIVNLNKRILYIIFFLYFYLSSYLDIFIGFFPELLNILKTVFFCFKQKFSNFKNSIN